MRGGVPQPSLGCQCEAPASAWRTRGATRGAFRGICCLMRAAHRPGHRPAGAGSGPRVGGGERVGVEEGRRLWGPTPPGTRGFGGRPRWNAYASIQDLPLPSLHPSPLWGCSTVAPWGSGPLTFFSEVGVLIRERVVVGQRGVACWGSGSPGRNSRQVPCSIHPENPALGPPGKRFVTRVPHWIEVSGKWAPHGFLSCCFSQRRAEWLGFLLPGHAGGWSELAGPVHSLFLRPGPRASVLLCLPPLPRPVPSTAASSRESRGPVGQPQEIRRNSRPEPWKQAEDLGPLNLALQKGPQAVAEPWQCPRAWAWLGSAPCLPAPPLCLGSPRPWLTAFLRVCQPVSTATAWPACPD